MARLRATIDFDVAAGRGTGDFEKTKLIVANEINNLLHKLVRPENLKYNRILFATATYRVKGNRYLFTQNDPGEEDGT